MGVTLFDDASLVLIPSGIKASKVYSVKPEDGTGDLTFTRASDATRTNSAGLIESVASNVPRLDYSGGATCPSLLVEGQRTNLFLQSESFDNASWSKTNVTLTSGILSPDGTNNAFRAESTGVASMIQGLTMTNGLTYNISLWIKSAGTGKDTLRLLQQTNRLFDVTATSEWVRYDFSFTNVYGTGGQNNGITRDALGNAFDVFIYGFQIEVGSFVSSYIPTTTAAVTRILEQVSISGASALIGQTEGTIFLDIDFRVVSSGGIRAFFGLEGSVGSQFSAFAVTTTNNNNNVNFAGTAYALTQGRHKIVCRYNSTTNESKLFVDGALRGAGTQAAFLATIDRLSVLGRINSFSGFDVDRQQFGGCNEFVVFPTALTDTQCIELSTL